MRYLRIDENSPFDQLIGVGGLGTGIFFGLEGDQTLGRNESRPGRLLDVKDYCKLHIVIHYVAKLLGAGAKGRFRIIPVGNVGDDSAGRSVIQTMAAVGIDTTHVRVVPTAPTLFSVCFQYPDGSGGNITTSNSAAGTLSCEDVNSLVGLLNTGGPRCIALAVPEVLLETRKRFLELSSRAGSFCAASFVSAEISPARNFGMFDLLDLVALNESEAEIFADHPFAPDSPGPFLEKCQQQIRAKYRNLKLIVSAGATGAYAITDSACDFCPAPHVEVASTAGAGDALLGGTLAAVAAGIPFVQPNSHPHTTIHTALQFGVLLASFKCLSPHTINMSADIDTLLEFGAEGNLQLASEFGSLISS
jgi:sugar/nucleoside kinase (ribokinase family)